MEASKKTRLHAHFVLSLLTGVRTEEARALTWDRVHLTAEGDLPPHVEVWRSVRKGGDTKTRKSRRTLALPDEVVRVLAAHPGTPARDPRPGVQAEPVEREQPRFLRSLRQGADRTERAANPGCRAAAGRPAGRVDAPGAAAQLRLAHVGQRRIDRTHRPPSRPHHHGDDRSRYTSCGPSSPREPRSSAGPSGPDPPSRDR